MVTNQQGRIEQAGAPLALYQQPSNLFVATFIGSLTTPPCTEGVRWVVMKQAISASAEQLAAFAHAIHHLNSRPTQPMNAREVLK